MGFSFKTMSKIDLLEKQERKKSTVICPDHCGGVRSTGAPPYLIVDIDRCHRSAQMSWAGVSIMFFRLGSVREPPLLQCGRPGTGSKAPWSLECEGELAADLEPKKFASHPDLHKCSVQNSL